MLRGNKSNRGLRRGVKETVTRNCTHYALAVVSKFCFLAASRLSESSRVESSESNEESMTHYFFLIFLTHHSLNPMKKIN